jgi:hypothetical protein
VVDGADGLVELVVLVVRAYLRHDILQLDEGDVIERHQRGCPRRHVHGSREHLNDGAVFDQGLVDGHEHWLAKDDIACVVTAGHPKTKCVRAQRVGSWFSVPALLFDLQRRQQRAIHDLVGRNDIAQRLRHLFPGLVQGEAVSDERLER